MLIRSLVGLIPITAIFLVAMYIVYDLSKD